MNYKIHNLFEKILTEHVAISELRDVYRKQFNEGAEKYVEPAELLLNFLLYLNDKKLINNHTFDYEKNVRKYLKKIQK